MPNYWRYKFNSISAGPHFKLKPSQDFELESEWNSASGANIIRAYTNIGTGSRVYALVTHQLNSPSHERHKTPNWIELIMLALDLPWSQLSPPPLHSLVRALFRVESLCLCCFEIPYYYYALNHTLFLVGMQFVFSPLCCFARVILFFSFPRLFLIGENHQRMMCLDRSLVAMPRSLASGGRAVLCVAGKETRLQMKQQNHCKFKLLTSPPPPHRSNSMPRRHFPIHT